MRLLVLGGTHHVGRATVEVALADGHDVTTVNRGQSGVDAPGVDARRADRRDPEALARALGDDRWDAVVDTWSDEPTVVRDAARLLSGRAGHYTYISSRSVFTWPIPHHADESAPVVDADPDLYAASLPIMEHPELTGRVIAALDGGPADAKRARSGRALIGAELASELGVSDVDGRAPVSRRHLLGGPRGYSDAVVR